MSRNVSMPVPRKPGGVEHHPHSITKVYKLQVITPLFGGGAEAGVNDPITLIRPSAVRGHLRFWWRATRGAACTSAEKLREREGEVWGTTNNSSPVVIEVAAPAWKETRTPDDGFGFGQYGPEIYALFAAKQNGNVLCKEGLSFALTIRWLDFDRLQELRKLENEQRRRARQPLLPVTVADIGPDIEAALWAWINFGGVGARTRRGCGALYCSAVAPNDPDIHPRAAEHYGQWLQAKLQSHGIPHLAAPRPWATFFRTVCVKASNQDALACWKDAIQLLKHFRQGVNLGRDPGTKPNRPGRSRWPEPEAIRELILLQRGLPARPAAPFRKKWHPQDARMPGSFFPRAELGMPIIFEIRDEGVPNSSSRKGDPDLKPTLQFSKDSDRMASPVILRPVRFADGKCAALMAVLRTEPLQSAWLKKGEWDLSRDQPLNAGQIRHAALASYPDSPLSGRTPVSPGTTPSALEAFESFAIEPKQGYSKVFP